MVRLTKREYERLKHIEKLCTEITEKPYAEVRKVLAGYRATLELLCNPIWWHKLQQILNDKVNKNIFYTMDEVFDVDLTQLQCVHWGEDKGHCVLKNNQPVSKCKGNWETCTVGRPPTMSERLVAKESDEQ